MSQRPFTRASKSPRVTLGIRSFCGSSSSSWMPLQVTADGATEILIQRQPPDDARRPGRARAADRFADGRREGNRRHRMRGKLEAA